MITDGKRGCVLMGLFLLFPLLPTYLHLFSLSTFLTKTIESEPRVRAGKCVLMCVSAVDLTFFLFPLESSCYFPSVEANNEVKAFIQSDILGTRGGVLRFVNLYFSLFSFLLLPLHLK